MKKVISSILILVTSNLFANGFPIMEQEILEEEMAEIREAFIMGIQGAAGYCDFKIFDGRNARYTLHNFASMPDYLSFYDGVDGAEITAVRVIGTNEKTYFHFYTDTETGAKVQRIEWETYYKNPQTEKVNHGTIREPNIVVEEKPVERVYSGTCFERSPQ